jgi:predicted XRE-type DNA-binding protein
MSDELYEWDDLYKKFLERTGTDPAEIEEGEERLLAEVRAYQLAQIRSQRGLTQKAVAEAMGVTTARVSQIENGELTSVDVLSRYAAALGGRLRIIVDFGGDVMAMNG